MDCCSEEKCRETELKKKILNNIYYTWIDKWTVAAKKNVEKTELDEKPYLKKEIIYTRKFFL